MPGTSTEFPFVGRERELGLLNEALNRTLAGQGQVVLLAGEAGMGKSRLAEKFASQASARGVEVHWGKCRDHAGAPPLWPWVQVFRSLRLARGLTRERVEESGANASDLAPLLPELVAGTHPNLELQEADQAEQFRLFQSAAWLLQRESSASPVLLILDNLHWADVTSLRLLEFVAPDMTDSNFALIATYRESEARDGSTLSSVMGELSKHQGFISAQLGRLDREEIIELIRMEADIEPPGGLTDAIYTHSDGSPFFAHNSIRLLKSRGDLEPDVVVTKTDWEIGVPSGVRQVISRQLGELDDDCVDFLRAAAVVGREFDLEVLWAISGQLTLEDLLELAEAAIDKRLIAQDELAPSRYRFSHELYRQVLEADLSRASKARLHAKIGRFLESQSPELLDRNSSRIAYHYQQAGPHIPVEDLVQSLIRAGRHAMETRAYAEAEQLLKSATVHAAQIGDAALTASTEDLFGRALWHAAKPPMAFDHLLSAFEGYLAIGNTRAALAIAALPVAQYGRHGLAAMLERALEVGEPDTEMASLLLSRLAMARRFEFEDLEGALDALQSAVSAAEACGSSRALGWAWGRLGQVEFSRFNFEQVNRLTDNIVASGAADADPELGVHALLLKTVAAIQQGDLPRADMQSARAQELAGQVPSLQRTRQAGYCRANVLKLFGRWKGAIATLEAGVRISGHIGDPGGPINLAPIHLAVGDDDRAEECVRQARSIWRRLDPEQRKRFTWLYLNDLTLLSLMTGDSSFVDTLDPEPGLESRLLSVTGVPFNPFPVATGAKMAVIRSKAGAAADALRIVNDPTFLGKLRSTEFSDLPSSTFGGSLDRLRGQLAVTAGRPGEAITWFEKAIEFCRNGFVYDLAWSCHDLAVLLIEQRQQLPRAADLIDESERIAEQYSLKPLLEKLAALRSQLPQAASLHPAGLSDREVEVLRLLAAGKSNREIADSLFISQNTVIRHVSNIYSKTGCSNRAEAASFAHRHGLANVDSELGG